MKDVKITGRRILSSTFWLIATGRNALVVLAASILAYNTCETHESCPFVLTGKVKSGFPDVELPKFHTIIQTHNGTAIEQDYKDMVSVTNIKFGKNNLLPFSAVERAWPLHDYTASNRRAGQRRHIEGFQQCGGHKSNTRISSALTQQCGRFVLLFNARDWFFFTQRCESCEWRAYTHWRLLYKRFGAVGTRFARALFPVHTKGGAQCSHHIGGDIYDRI